MRLTRLPRGIELYFPPFRTPGAHLSLALFGLACLIPGLFAMIAMAPLSLSGAAGAVATWLMSLFVLPFVAFGVLFLALAAYRLANSLTVVVTESGIQSLRRVVGLPVRESRVARADIVALDAIPVAHARWLRDEAPLYKLVVSANASAGLNAQSRYRKVTVAESLRGEESMKQARAAIVSAARLEHLPSEPDSP